MHRDFGRATGGSPRSPLRGPLANSNGC